MDDETRQSIAWWNGVLGGLVVWAPVAVGLALAVWRWGGAWCERMGGLCRGIVVASAFVGRRGSAVLDEMVDEIASLRWRVQELRVRLSAAEGLLGIGAFTATPTQSIEWLSPHAVELFGSDSADLLGGNWLARIDDESRDAIESAWSLACGKRIATSCAVVTIGGRNLRISLNPSVDTAGQVVSVYGRVTERK